MTPIVIFLITIATALTLIALFSILSIRKINTLISSKEKLIIDLFFGKVNKMPALVEIMKKQTRHPAIFEDITYLHKLGIISNITSIYDLLDINYRMHREFQFLMKLSAKIPELHRQGTFLYMRDCLLFQEGLLEKEITDMNMLFSRLNKFIRLKNIAIVGLLYPVEERILI